MNKLQHMENALIDAHNNNNNTENINEVFRAVHTVKGVSDLLGFSEVVKLTHKSEDVLDQVRQGKLKFDSSLFYLFIELKKFIVQVIDEISRRFDISSDSKRLFNTFEQELIAYLPLSILIVDDSEDLNNLAFIIEENTDYKVIVQKSGILGLEAIKSNNVGLVLCDISDSSIGGVSMLNEIKSHTKLIPAVLLTNKADSNLKIIGQSTGAKAWLKKPLVEDQVLTVINKILG